MDRRTLLMSLIGGGIATALVGTNAANAATDTPNTTSLDAVRDKIAGHTLGAADIGAIIDWHRGRACQVTSVLIDREPPVVACIAIPAVDDQAAVIGVAAARTGAA